MRPPRAPPYPADTWVNYETAASRVSAEWALSGRGRPRANRCGTTGDTHGQLHRVPPSFSRRTLFSPVQVLHRVLLMSVNVTNSIRVSLVFITALSSFLRLHVQETKVRYDSSNSRRN